MTSLALLAVLLAAGWYFYRQWRYTRFEALHHPGHPQYFGAALCAVYLFAFGAALHALSLKWPAYSHYLAQLESLLPLQSSEKQSPASLRLHLAITLWSLALSASLPVLFNDPLIRVRSLAQLIAARHGAIDPIEGLTIKCEEDGTLVALTLDNGKFYAGFPETFTGPRVGKDWVSLTPLASGYRDACGKLSLTTFYDIDLPDETTTDIFRVIVSSKQIVSAQAFDLALYKQFQISSERSDSPAPPTGTAASSPKSLVDDTRHALYLGLPALLLAAPYVALLGHNKAGLFMALLSGAACIAAERLPIKVKRKQTEASSVDQEDDACFI
ncbi:hypothetical protein I5U42_09180 [Stenotrophomonas maltophilia]|uniref:hypothetical protein n=1 Tax=Stenotrophomonas maltophilia TaxID=40324 RepID=UPI0018D45C2F|nr:hypothetical protein [Stenotrophomonas maltophilia]MBH1431463.1 hypothetical protein [Stenotrophomonas maltophilia]MBH1525344.1 hypothetical protein [Stenotrophomonas maltophilia]MBH1817290.1 hypothetical protein [Stenotrophomonas maltophilia]MBH1889862.1 hypothetical protein [Stenotrophomonas maltophilia]MCU1030430.1 hypothetical protein [Stenotrophomonas maltophilia]